jgi:hypothetical protein
MKTAHDLQQDAVEQERTDFKRAQEVRRELMRECPAGWFLDREHLSDMLHQSPASNRPWLAWVYVAVHGAAACGVLPQDLTGRWQADDPLLTRFLAGDVYWDPEPSRFESIPAQIRARVIGAR